VIEVRVMSVSTFIDRLRRPLARFRADRSGMSAVEFAMLLPLMMTLYLGSAEISQGISIDRKVTLTARALADLASQPTSITNADMTNILNAAASIVAPYPVSKLTATVSEIKIDSNGKATVTWSDTLNGTARSVGQVVTLPSALAVPNTALILGEVQYSYTPAIGYVVTGTLTLKDQMYMRPRQAAEVQRTTS
jgi:Flp pilus assembly protein TadG